MTLAVTFVFDTFVQLTVTGLANGAILALAALGFVIIYKATEVINFAQGALLLLGGYVVASGMLNFGLHWSLALVFGVLVAVVLGVGVERTILRPMVGESAISVIMVTVGLAAILEAIVQIIWGVAPRAMPDTFIVEGTTTSILGASIPTNRVWAIVIAAVALTVFTIFFRRSRLGIAMRAVADDQQAAMTMGISVPGVFALSWVLAAISAVFAGFLLGHIAGVSGELAVFGLVVFPVVIVGGLDSIPGAVIGGIIIGLTNSYAAGYIPADLIPAPSQVIPWLVLVAILMFKPYGLFGEERIERV